MIALAVAFVASLTIRVRQDQAELEEALQSNVGAAARIRSDYERERASLARLLHAGVQSELIAGALAADGDAGGGGRTATARARRRGRRPCSRRAAQRARRTRTPQTRSRALVESWSSAIDLRGRIDDGVWERLGDPARASAVVDAVSEGLANAVRHGDGSPVTRRAATGAAATAWRS